MSKKMMIFGTIIIMFFLLINGVHTVKADKSLEDNNLKIKTERVTNDKSINDKDSGSSKELFDSQDSKIRKDILKEQEKKLESGKNEIFSKYYKQGKSINSRKLFESKHSNNIKVTSKKSKSNVPIIGGIMGGLATIGTGIGLSVETTRRE